MPAAELTPVERGALLVLMAEGRPLKENAELKGIHGVTLQASHRNKLQRLGLIQSTKKPLTHSLSEKGWQWAAREMAASRPKGRMGMGALYAVLGSLQRHAERHGYKLKDVFGATEAAVSDVFRREMREAAWSEADEALGMALQDIPVLTKALENLQQSLPADFHGLAKRTSSAANLVLQSVRRAGHKRELALVMEAGEVTVYDPVMHLSYEATQPGKRVRIRKPPVVRGSAKARVVVLPGEVVPV